MNGNSENAETKPPRRTNLFFRLTAVAAAVFAITVLALTSTIFGDPRAPVHQFLDQYGGILIAAEVAFALFCGLLALAVDRRGIVNQAASRSSQDVDEESTNPRGVTPETMRMGESVAGGDDS